MESSLDSKKHTTHLLTYALADDGKLVHIDNTVTGANCSCYCPICKEPLIAKNMGQIRAHHFAHQSGTECKYAHESMLHLLAKERIQERFLTSQEFNIEFVYKSHCPNYQSCHFIHYSDCYTPHRNQFNLKTYYDSCEQEVAYDTKNRRSDLKIYSSEHPDRKPIYIEFCVSHASEQEKLHSGAKIIECLIESEDDITYILEKGFITDCVDNANFDDGIMDNKIKFYGFKDSDYCNNQQHCEIEFSRYVLYKSGKTRCFQDLCDCKNIVKSSHHSLLEICFHTSCAFGIYDAAKYIGYSIIPIANCILCKNYVDSYNDMGKICRFYKYLQIDKYDTLDTSRAKNCPKYEFNQDGYNEIMSGNCDLPPYEVLK